MSDHIYKTLEVTGSSPTSVDEAIRRAIKKTSETVRHIDWFEVTGVRGHVEQGDIGHYQVTVKMGFRLE